MSQSIPTTTSSPTVEVSSTYRAKVIARDIFAGTLGGIAVTLVGHPFDTLKVRLQTQPSNPPLYNGLVDCFRKTIKWEGPTGLYRGVTSPLAGQMFFRALTFLSYNESKRAFRGGATRDNTLPEFFIAGSIGWTAGTLAECPIDLAKSQMQVQIIRTKVDPTYVSPYKSTFHAAQCIVKQNGIFGMYQGFSAHLIRNIPGGALHLGTFEYMRDWFARRNNYTSKSQLSVTENLIAGGLGGLNLWLVVFPIDVIKSAFQTDSIVKSERRTRGVLQTARMLYQEGGIKRFYRGFSPCLLRSIPANAAMLFVQQFVIDQLKV